MESHRRTNLIGGIVLILVGVYFLAVQLFPELGPTLNIEFSWPLILVGVGGFLLLFGLLVNAPDMAVPACIVAGIGGILYYQNMTGDWASWAYAWALIPGFAGLGSIVAGLLKGNSSRQVREGMSMIVVSAILFVIFGSFLGGLDLLGPYWPVLLILAGLWVLVSGILRRRKQE